ncbi:hypothetical protein CABS01_02623 [Colletotrichum abscissum]|uniref:Uncharacterized protein n=1 Tax=Colletotrichum abscissum TaxID=1671311 RepID=A0A9Q0B7H1_9PEZI|nr:uncharacterized protein CABS01_02623 [Colletotrichum abscissum]KAI3558065.1 hypothetical protein CABS02_01738 [Colletotrichum abscissum]KAK1482887.1 hypothetical protein CABS01_02623 [Colletotrichum abscissum]
MRPSVLLPAALVIWTGPGRALAAWDMRYAEESAEGLFANAPSEERYYKFAFAELVASAQNLNSRQQARIAEQDEEIHELKMMALNLTESIVEAKTNASNDLLHELHKFSETMETISSILQALASSDQSQNRDVPGPDGDAARNAVFHGFNPVIIRFLERIATKLEKPESEWSADKKTMATMAIFTGIATALNYLRGPIGRTGCYKKIAKWLGCAKEEKLAKKAALEALEGQVNYLWKAADKGLAFIKAAVNDRAKHEELDLLKGELDAKVETLTARVDEMATAERVTGLECRVDVMAEAARVTDLERRVSELTSMANNLAASFSEQAIRSIAEAKTLRDNILALETEDQENLSRIKKLQEDVQHIADDLDAHQAQLTHFM